MPASPSNPKITAALSSMRMLLNAGLPIQKVFRNCGDVAGNPWRRSFERAAQMADEGEPFEKCLDQLRDVLPFAERVMLTIGWNSGRIDDILPKVVKRRENLAETVRKFRSAMIQPTLTLIAACFVIPLPQAVLGKISPERYLVEALLPLFLVFCVCFGIWMIMRMRMLQMGHRKVTDPPLPPGVFDHVLYVVPFFHQMQVYRNTGEFCDILGNLLFAGMRIDEALQMAAVGLPNGIYRKAVANMALTAREGDEFRDGLLKSRIWPNGFVDIMEVADTAGNLETVLLARAEGYREDYDRAVRALGVVIARSFYVLVSAFIVYHIFRIAMVYVGMINTAASGGNIGG
jgi:type II secretory pathway component PulF